jgi:hypothetical protein
MKNEIKLILALQQINNLTDLLHGNEYQTFLYGRLISVKCELERQLTNLTHTDKLKE